MIGFIVEGFNDEASIKEVYPDAYIVVTKGTRFDKRVKMDIEKAISNCEVVFILMDPDEPKAKVTVKLNGTGSIETEIEEV